MEKCILFNTVYIIIKTVYIKVYIDNIKGKLENRNINGVVYIN